MMGAEKEFTAAGGPLYSSREQIIFQLKTAQQKNGSELSAFDAKTQEQTTETFKKLEDSRNEDQQEFSKERDEKIEDIESRLREYDF